VRIVYILPSLSSILLSFSSLRSFSLSFPIYFPFSKEEEEKGRDFEKRVEEEEPEDEELEVEKED
jgi:hypothetical protein